MALTVDQQNAYAREIQRAFPLHERPFDELAGRLDCSPAQLIDTAEAWCAEHKLREISAILEGQALGYESALVAAKVESGELERVAAVVNAHPTVTHNYERSHDYNLWFTIAVPKTMGLGAALARLSREAGVAEFLPLPRTSTFKIGVNFDLIKKQSLTDRHELQPVAEVRVEERERAMFRALQTPLPLSPRPFRALAQRADVSESELLDFARRHSGGAVRRYAATFHHRTLGVRGNGMVVWDVPACDHARVGATLAAAPEVSHCYARTPIHGFPFSVYSMIHGPDRASVSEVAERLSRQTGVSHYLELFSTREFKKCRLRYFLSELDVWWSGSGGTAALQ